MIGQGLHGVSYIILGCGGGASSGGGRAGHDQYCGDRNMSWSPGGVVMVVALKIVLRMAAVAVWKVVLEVAIRMLMRTVGVPWEYSRFRFVVASVMAVVGVIVRSQAALVKSSTLSPRLPRQHHQRHIGNLDILNHNFHYHPNRSHLNHTAHIKSPCSPSSSLPLRGPSQPSS